MRIPIILGLGLLLFLHTYVETMKSYPLHLIGEKYSLKLVISLYFMGLVSTKRLM